MKLKNKLSYALYFLLATVFFTSCVKQINYTIKTTNTFNKLKSPVVLFTKAQSFGSYNVTLKDCDGKLYYFGNMSELANGIGQNYKIGDTIK